MVITHVNNNKLENLFLRFKRSSCKRILVFMLVVLLPIKICQVFILLLKNLRHAISPIKLYLRFKFGKLPSDDFGWL